MNARVIDHDVFPRVMRFATRTVQGRGFIAQPRRRDAGSRIAGTIGAMRSVVLVAMVVGLVATSKGAGATPWGKRCKARLAKAAVRVKAIGRANITIAPPPKPRADKRADLDAFGQVSFAIVAGDHTFTASIGSDHSGHRYRGRRGIHSKRYEEWHSPYTDSLNGDPPNRAEQPMLEEFHHRVAVGVIRAELRIDVAVKGKRHRAPGSRSRPAYTGQQKLFADTLRPVLAACWADVSPDEADPSLAWTTKCLTDLSRAHAALVKRDPIFGNGTCAREPFDVSCGHVDGAEPTWNALTTLAGGPVSRPTWTVDGAKRRSYANGGALIWGSAKLTTGQFAELSSAFEKPLERCWKLLRKNMYLP